MSRDQRDEFMILFSEFLKSDYEYEKIVPFREIETNELFSSYLISKIKKWFESCGAFIENNIIYYIPYLLFRFIEERKGWIFLLEMNEFYAEYPEIKEKIQEICVCPLIRKLGYKRQLFLSKKKYILTVDYIHRHLITYMKNYCKGKMKVGELVYFCEEYPEIKPIIEKFGIKEFINCHFKNLSYYSKYVLILERGFLILSRKNNGNWDHDYNDIPEEFRIFFENVDKLSIARIEESHKEILKSRPTSTHYQKENKFHYSINLKELNQFFFFFNDLLYVEETKLLTEISKYDMESARLFAVWNSSLLYQIDIPGLDERRPSILKNDRLKLKDNLTNTVIEGIIKHVNLDNIHISLPKYMTDEIYVFDIHFELNRTQFRIMHEAFERWAKDENLQKLFISSSSEFNKLPYLKSTSPLNNVLSRQLNSMQLKFISAAISSCDTPFKFPLIIIGPPGTGKTTTIVESIIQILNYKSNTKILVCTPSNSSADLICERLMKAFDMVSKNKDFKNFNKTKIMRINAASRDPNTVSQKAKENWNLKYENNAFVFPSKKEIMAMDIVVCTTSTAGRLVSLELKIFSHIFCDESGQSLVGETLIPLSLKKADTNIILVGDPHQLSPIVFSPLVKDYGMEISILERLYNIRKAQSNKNLSKINQYLSVGIFHLYENYRAHQGILNLYNEMFYEGILKAKGDQTLIKWEGLKNRAIPVLFKHVKGFERNDQDSPSWYNLEEVGEIIKILSQLHKAFNYLNVGIISPYRKHCEKISKALEHQALFSKENIRVGSVENFQGGERDINIISFVRSNKLFPEEHINTNLDFINDPRRINVAISRAKNLLIIIGNAEVLNLEGSIFSQLLKKMDEMGCYAGPALFS